MGTIHPLPEQLQAFFADAANDGAIVMINLLKFREEAVYDEGANEEPCSGREAYQRYSALAFPQVTAVNGTLLWLGKVEASLIAPVDEAWDEALLVQYPSKQAFLQMISSPEYQKISTHRTAALADSRLIATTTQAGKLT
jgi:uncharacterized protein (DUF1330 family)